MKRLFAPFLFLSSTLFAQTNTEDVVRRVADRILQTTFFQFVNNKTGEKFRSTKGKDTTNNVKAESKFNKGQYVNGVLTVGMLRISDVLNDAKYLDYSRRNFGFIFDNLDYFKRMFDAGNNGVEYRPVFRIGSLDDCGSMSAGLLDVYAFDKRKDYLDYLNRVSDYILNKQVRFPDGTLARNGPRKMTLWADDLYMSVPYLARMGKLPGDKKYFDFAIQQVENFNRYIYDSTTGLYFHTFFNDENMNGVARWGRCNGWVALAQVELLNNLPANHPKRPELTKLLLRQIVGFSRYQDTSGMWHQLLDKPESYLESSVTAMYVYTVAKAVNEGWINKRFITVAQRGWDALVKRVTADGQIPDICVGTSVEEDLSYYFNRPRETNDTHGLGAFLMAGAEMIKAKDKLVDLSKRR
ncbi:glycoside hydrolase family 88/105 protein [Flavisolibacter ginsenosidimutans]|uniref:Glycoside hydrolase family 88 protein n=1 Tax=Flavisolibacter ginsenosidimutans TaxID=661481 RepID=A0A5B8UHZ2_9BACT|nr:glycoside hydrolase family 88 protein [Flavisolibacter ginsenosidimutans]QEC56133.1 glycoside hydrolase family 88 protein [Flavisolibacter ginsenosidimutans]